MRTSNVPLSEFLELAVDPCLVKPDAAYPIIAKAAGMDLGTAFEAIRISSGNSFVHETESQVILNGSRDISFTMDLVSKDIGLFQAIADRAQVPLEINPLMIDIFKDGEARYGSREWAPNIIRPRASTSSGTERARSRLPSSRRQASRA